MSEHRAVVLRHRLPPICCLPLSRRNFSRSIAALALTGLGRAIPASEKRLPIVDTHVHCFAGTSDARFPYHKDGPYQPEKASTPEDLLDCMKQAGVDFTVIVHPEPYQDDHRYLEHCLDVGKGKLKGTCLFFAGRLNSIREMTALVKRQPGKIVALRIHAYAPNRLPPFGKPELRELWKSAADLGLAIQLHFEPRYATGFEPLIQEFSKTKVIMDHLGRPLQGTPEEHDRVVKWSRFENTVMKLSSIPTKRTYPHREIEPIIHTLVRAFGPERLIYGGGWGEGSTGESYRASVEGVRSFLPGLSVADRARVLGGNAARLFGFS
ncbi:MAG: amidohydrolase [Planctomycetes bacterium]|nr:amidohydrolase [Planctomycetota bacterium]